MQLGVDILIDYFSFVFLLLLLFLGCLRCCNITLVLNKFLVYLLVIEGELFLYVLDQYFSITLVQV